MTVAIVWTYFTPSYWEVGYMPEQPVAYSHQLHAGTLGIDCRYCHDNVEESGYSNIPSSSVCMSCHTVVDNAQGYLAKAVSTTGGDSVHWANENLAKLRDAYDHGEAIEWTRVHKLPDYVHFDHSIHVNLGVSCYSCHTRIDQMPEVYQSQPLSMGWCLDCHREPEHHLVDTSEVDVTNLRRVQEMLSQSDYAQTTGMLLAQQVDPPQNCGACHY
ncbi:MAG: cytochrome c3 family protein [Phycisphaerales bacterium JB043]